MPFVSVIMASYNHEKYVGRAVQSVLDQTLKDFELVITDDSSRDGTAAEIAKFADPRIRFFRFPANRGQFVATNHCLGQARGQYVAVLNSDDMFLPTKLQSQVGFLEDHPQVGAVFSQVRLIDEQDRVVHGTKMFQSTNLSRFEWLNRFFYRGNCLCHPSVLIRRRCHEVVGGYDERYAQLADYDLWIRLCLKYEMHVLPDELVAFRLLSQAANMSGKRPDSIRRTRWEQRHILDNFLSIDSCAFLLKVFPEAEKYGDDIDAALIPFVLAMLASQAKSGRQAYRSFVLDTLFRLLGEPQIADALSRRFGFHYRDFVRLTGQYDVFDVLGARQRRDERQRGLSGWWGRVRRSLSRA
jgi:glycosyltransferase involved in cell wall biosynthesis